MASQIDPVCGMQVNNQQSAEKSQHQGQIYYFCSEDCKRKFDQKPEQYTAKAGQARSGGANR